MPKLGETSEKEPSEIKIQAKLFNSIGAGTKMIIKIKGAIK